MGVRRKNIMNYYFLLEDSKSFLKVLPEWLKYINFKCERVPDIQHVKENNYVLQSGQGVTQLITKVHFDTIETIIENRGKIDKLVVVLDSEEETVSERKKQVYDKIKETYKLEQLDFEIVVLAIRAASEICSGTWITSDPVLTIRPISRLTHQVA